MLHVSQFRAVRIDKYYNEPAAFFQIDTASMRCGS